MAPSWTRWRGDRRAHVLSGEVTYLPPRTGRPGLPGPRPRGARITALRSPHSRPRRDPLRRRPPTLLVAVVRHHGRHVARPRGLRRVVHRLRRRGHRLRPAPGSSRRKPALGRGARVHTTSTTPPRPTDRSTCTTSSPTPTASPRAGGGGPWRAGSRPSHGWAWRGVCLTDAGPSRTPNPVVRERWTAFLGPGSQRATMFVPPHVPLS